MERKKKVTIITIALLLLLLLLALAIALPLALGGKKDEGKPVSISVTTSQADEHLEKWYSKTNGQTTENENTTDAMEVEFISNKSVIYGLDYTAEYYDNGGHFSLDEITYDNEKINLKYAVVRSATNFEDACEGVSWKAVDGDFSYADLGRDGFLLLEISLKAGIEDVSDLSLNLVFSYFPGSFAE